jgi:hypothetical protein
MTLTDEQAWGARTNSFGFDESNRRVSLAGDWPLFEAIGSFCIFGVVLFEMLCFVPALNEGCQ